MIEFNTKLSRVHSFLKEHRLSGALLSTRANFSWLTCGGTNHVRTDSDKGVASLFITPKSAELWTNQIEEPRLKAEETKGLSLQYRVHPWYENGRGEPRVRPGQGDDKHRPYSYANLGSDDGAYGTKNLGKELSVLRWSLLPEEIRRYREVGRLSGEAMNQAARQVRKGWTEQKLAAVLSANLVERGLEASVVLVGSDERLTRFRHPIPKPKKIRKTVMMVVCAKGYGLIANLTRIVHFGKVPADLTRRHMACLQVECAMWDASKPGVTAGSVFNVAAREYLWQGFQGEESKHHQGGPTGYETRDYVATPTEARTLVENQALAWNPSITGTKSEDTILMTSKGLELLTPTPGWPMVKVNYGGKEYLRPNILSVKG